MRAYNLQGALLGWTHEGLPLQVSDKHSFCYTAGAGSVRE